LRGRNEERGGRKFLCIQITPPPTSPLEGEE